MSGFTKAFDITDRDYRIRAYWGTKANYARVTIHKGKELCKKFRYPAYKIFNLAAHFRDIVDGLEAENARRGFEIAGSDLLGGHVMPKEDK